MNVTPVIGGVNRKTDRWLISGRTDPASVKIEQSIRTGICTSCGQRRAVHSENVLGGLEV
jgi:hypothetical protein